jgi:hypothetical protein
MAAVRRILNLDEDLSGFYASLLTTPIFRGRLAAQVECCGRRPSLRPS